MTRTIDGDFIQSSDHHHVWTPPSSTDNLVGWSSFANLTNKTISGATNTITNLTPSSYDSGTGANANTFLNGLGTWATPTPSGGGGGSGITALTGDVTASGTGSVAATLATVNANTGAVGTPTSVPVLIVNGKGLITSATPTPIQISEAQVTNLVSDLASKQASLTIGNLTDAGTDGITVTGGTGSIIGSGTSLSQHVADSTHAGYLASADWTTFNGKQAAGNYVTALTGDVTASGPGSSAATLASSISGAKTFSTSLTSPAFISSTANVASTGALRLASSDLIYWRNNANSADIFLGKNTSDNLMYNGVAFLNTSSVLLAAAFPALTGDLTTSVGSLTTTLATVNTNTGSIGTPTSIPVLSINGKGLITSATPTPIQISEAQVTNLVSDLAGKQASLTIGNLTDAGTDGITVTSGTGSVIGSGTSLSQHVADSTHAGYLASADWTTFNGKQAAGNYMTALTGDVTAAGPGSSAATLASSISGAKTFSTSLTSPIFSSSTASVASAGTLRLASHDPIEWRNAANTGNLSLVNGGGGGVDRLLFNGDILVGQNTTDTLSNKILADPVIIGAGLDFFVVGVGNVTLTVDQITPSAAYTLTLPPNPGATGQVLTTDGAGITTWTTVSGGGGGGITALTGDVTASGSGSVAATLATVNTNTGSIGTPTSVPVLVVNGKGLITSATPTPIQIAEAQVTNLVSDLAGKQASLTIGNLTAAGTDGIVVTSGTGSIIGSGTSLAQNVSDTTHNGYLTSTDWNTFNGKQASGSYITAITGDATASGPGSAAITFATVNTNTGSIGTPTSIPVLVVNGKGLVTSASPTPIQISEAQVTNLVSDLAGKQASGSYMTALTGDVTASGPGSSSATIANSAVTNVKIANMNAHTYKGNATGSAAAPTDLSQTTLTAELNAMVGDSGSGGTKGLVPPPGAGDAAAGKFLKADATWGVPAGGGGGGSGTVGGFVFTNGANVTGTVTTPTSTPTLSLAPTGTTQTASSFAAWDANSNLSANNHFNGYTTTVTASGTTTLTALSTYEQYFTGTAVQTVKMPAANALPATGASYLISNKGTQIVTIQDNSAGAIGTLPGGLAAIVTTTNVGSTAGTWDLYVLGPKITWQGDGVLFSSTTTTLTQTTPNILLNPLTAAANAFYMAPATGSGSPVFRKLGSVDFVAANAANNWMQNFGLGTSVSANAMTLTTKQNDGSTNQSSGLGSSSIGFRSSTSTSGAYTIVNVNSASTLTIPSGATLGQTSAVAQYVWVYLLNNAGSVELAVSGVKLFDDFSIQTSTTISSGATSGSTLYSSTGRSNVPVRLVGRVLVTEATAGTWASGATEVAVVQTKPQPNITDWVSYTPTWSGSGGAPAIGNGSLTGQYRRVGDTAYIQVYWSSGSTTTFGTGNWGFSLPSGLTYDSTKLAVGTSHGVAMGTCRVIGNSLDYTAMANLSTTGILQITNNGYNSSAIGLVAVPPNQTTQLVTDSSPIAWSAAQTNFITMEVQVPISGWSAYGP